MLHDTYFYSLAKAYHNQMIGCAREARLLHQLPTSQPALGDRVLSGLGESMIRLGTRLKSQHAPAGVTVVHTGC